MEPKELRIGLTIKQGTIELLEVRKSVITCIRTEKGTYSEVEPIPLTEEWLLKFGFENIQRGFYSIKAGSTFLRLTPPQFMGEWQAEYCWVYDDFKFTEIKYVHQLQNLFFALTGEELELNF